MTSNKGWLFMSDLDGTLLNRQKQVSDENRLAIKAFVQSGGLFTVATGRTELTCRLATAFLPVTAPAVLYNGAAIYDFAGQKFLWTQTMRGTPFVPLIHSLVARWPKLNVQVFQGGPLLLVNPQAEPDPYILSERQLFECVEPDHIRSDVFKVMFRADHACLQEVQAQVAAWRQVSGVAFDMFFSADYYLEIVPPHCSKGACLAWICAHCGIGRENTLAIGDHANDVDMLCWAACSAAPENAIQAAKDAAKWIVSDCDRHAAEAFMQKFATMRAGGCSPGLDATRL